MATIEETLAGKSDAELMQLLSRLSDDLELQRAEVGLPVDETPQQIAAKRAAGDTPMPTPMDKKPEEMMGEMTAAETPAETPAEESTTEMEVSPEGDVTVETETETPAAGAPRVMAKLVEFGLPDKAAEKMAQLYAEAMGGEDAAMAELEGSDFAGTKNMARLSDAFSSKYERATGRRANEDRISAMMA